MSCLKKLFLPFPAGFTGYSSRSNHMFGRAIWDKLPKWIFEIFEIAQVKRGQFQNFNKSRQ